MKELSPTLKKWKDIFSRNRNISEIDNIPEEFICDWGFDTSVTYTQPIDIGFFVIQEDCKYPDDEICKKDYCSCEKISIDLVTDRAKELVNWLDYKDNFSQTGYCQLRHQAAEEIGDPWCGQGVAFQEHIERETDKFMVQNGCRGECDECEFWIIED